MAPSFAGLTAPAGASPPPPPEVHPTPLVHAHAPLHVAGKQPLFDGAMSADTALTAALLAAKTSVAVPQERVRTTALTLEREHTATDTVARHDAEVERSLLVDVGQQPIALLCDIASSL